MPIDSVSSQVLSFRAPAAATGSPTPVQPRARQDQLSLSDRFWGKVNHAAAKPVQTMFKHMSNAKTPDMESLQRLGSKDAQEIVAHAQRGDLILWGDKDSFVHASVYEGNGTLVHALAARAPEGQKNGVVKETVESYVSRVERERVVILRPKHPSAPALEAEVAFADKQLGKDYDYLFRTGKQDAYYCTELAWTASQQGAGHPEIKPHRAALGLKAMVTNDDLRTSPDMVEVWSKNAPAVGKVRAVGLS